MATTIGTPAALMCAIASLRLRHDAVVGRNDEDRDVGDLRAARAHRRERFVTGRIDERDLAVVLRSTVYAPIFCVMPPASPAATLAERILSSSDVLP